MAVGRAIVRKPKVFLFDEPLSNLDAKMRVHMRLELAKLHHKLQTTIIYVTHDQLEAMTLANQVALMKEGTVQQVAPPLEIYHKPANKFVAGFIGNPPMNFVETTVTKAGSALRLAFGKTGGTDTLDIANGVKAALLPYAGQKVILGIRPEDIYDKVYYQGDAKGRTVSTTVEVVEPMGAEKYLYLSARGLPIVVRVGADNNAHIKQVIDVVFRMENAKFFNAETDAVIA